MKIDVFVIRATNTSHEMNSQKTKSDSKKEIQFVKNAKTKHIVNIERIDEVKKTNNTEIKKDI